MGMQVPIKAYICSQEGEIMSLILYWMPRNSKLVCTPNDIAEIVCVKVVNRSILVCD